MVNLTYSTVEDKIKNKTTLVLLLPLDMVSAGDHCERRISRQMEPLLFMLGW